MAKNSSQQEERRDVKIPVTCMDCKHAALHRYGNDPILAACHCKPQPANERFPFEVEIASVLRLCATYRKDNSPKEVEQREHWSTIDNDRFQKTGEFAA